MAGYRMISIVISLLSLGWVDTAIAQPTNTPPDSFEDINNHWSRHVINWLAGNNPSQTTYLDTTEPTFNPGCPITRGEWVALSTTVFDLNNRPDSLVNQLATAPQCPDRPDVKCPFSDIPAMLNNKPTAAHPHYQSTFQAFRTGMVSGYPDGTFRPEQPLTYAEAIASLAAVFELVPQIDRLKEQANEDSSVVGTDYFINGSAFTNSWFTPALHGTLLANLVALDWPLEFYPYQPPVSRGEAAVMLYLSLAHENKASLEDPILQEETMPQSGEYARRHIRIAGEPNFSFSPPAVQRQCMQ